MNTTTAPVATIRNADIADELVAGQSFPMRNALVRTTPASARALFRARRAFWLAAAAGYAAQAEAGCPESGRDAAEATEQADLYAGGK